MREEADATHASDAVLAKLAADSLELWAWHAAVVVLARISPPLILAGVHAEGVRGVDAVLDVREVGAQRALLAGAEEGDEMVIKGE